MSSFSERSQSDSSSIREDCLGDLIAKTACESVLDRREFFPAGCFEALITKKSLMEELAIAEDDLEDVSKEKLLEYILTQGKRIFAILIELNFAGKELLMAMEHFMMISFGDSSLPITTETVESILFTKRKNKPVRPWTTKLIRDFRWRQFEYISPVFGPDNLNMQLHARTIFPFLSQGNDRRTGAFGEVFQVDIHPSHYHHPIMTFDGKRSRVAVKRIWNDSNDERKLRIWKAKWEDEVNAHIAINKCDNGVPHPNIIEFVAAVTRGQDHYLVLQWADGGNLREFWQATTKPQLSVSLIRDVVGQLYGLADALKCIHEVGYRHGDLKPENILRINSRSVTPGSAHDLDVGILKIADMGLASYHVVQTELRPPTRMAYSTYRYEPPEVFSEYSITLGGRSRRQDMWSFGCFALEFVIWLLYGTVSLYKFNKTYLDDQTSSFYQIGVNGGDRSAIVHPVVVETMDRISKDQESKSKGNSAMKDLLEIIRTKLLVVRLGSGYGSRATAKELCDGLRAVIENGEKDTHYWFTGESACHNQHLPEIRSLGSPSIAPTSTLPVTEGP